MSTRLLTNPGIKHILTDDIESHFFVLMWAALHWVKHKQSDQSSINMEFIFDHQWSGPTELPMGGAGKGQMYGNKRILCNLEFACKPFNDLFWSLWQLFAGYFAERVVASVKGAPGE